MLDEFWYNERGWPMDPPGWLFLGRAVKVFASKMADDGVLMLAQLKRLQFSDHRLNAKMLPGLQKGSEGDPAQREALRLAVRERLSAALRCKFAIIEQLREWAEGSPFLATATRPRHGGVLRPLPPVAWSSQNLQCWFHECLVDPANPYGFGVSGPRHEHIFVAKDQFEALVRQHIDNEQPLHQPQPLNGSECNPGSDSEIEAWARDAAERNVAIRNALADAKKYLGSGAPPTSQCVSALHRAYAAIGQSVRRGRRPESKSFINNGL